MKVWLFSFLDLAFLLLIAFSQISHKDQVIKFKDINVTKVVAPKEKSFEDGNGTSYFLKIKNKDYYANEKDKENKKKQITFHLSSQDYNQKEHHYDNEKILIKTNDKKVLFERLNTLYKEQTKKEAKKAPSIVPSSTARYQDVLIISKKISEIWNGPASIVIINTKK